MSKPQRSILLIDDSTEDRVAFRRYLERSGDATYICYEAATVAEALEQCRTLHPDVILVDYRLPDDDGLTFLSNLITEHGAHAFPVIMLTSSGNEAVAVEAMKLGAHDYLVKDTTIKDRLTLAVARALENVRLQRQVEQQRCDLEASNRQLQQALLAQQNSDMQLRLALQATRMCTWEWNLPTNQVQWSAGLESLFGALSTERDHTLDSVWGLVHPDDQPVIREHLAHTLEEGTLPEIEFRIVQSDEHVIWLAARGYVIYNDQQQPVRLSGIVMDISERRQTAAALRISEERYRALVTATSHVVWGTDAIGTHFTAISDWRELTGQEAAESQDGGWMQTLHPDDREAAIVAWRHAIASQTVFTHELRLRTRDGSYRYYQARAVPVYEADGVVREWVGTNTDITIRKQAEADLRRREAEFKGLVENAPDIIARFDHAFRFLYISPAAEQALGIAPEAFIGKTKRELGMPESLCAIWEAHLINVFETGRTEEFEYVLAVANGDHYYQATLVPELAEHGTVETVMSIARDVTAFKVLEGRLRFLSDASTALGSSLDYQATLEHVARLTIPYLADACSIDLVEQQVIRAVVVAHRDSEREAILREMRRRYPPRFKSKHPVAQVLQTQQPMIVYEIPQSLIDDQSYDAHHRALLQELDLTSFLMVPFVVRGQPIGVLSLYVTGQPRSYTVDDLALVEELVRRASMALDNAQLYQEAQEAIRERDAFVSIASHEIKNPLTSLFGRAQMLQRRFAPLADHERTQRDIDTIIEQTNRINALLSSMLDASRLSNDQFTIERTSVNLNDIFQLVIAGLQPATPTHQITLVEHDPPLVVVGDSGRLEQVFSNLINNAIKYSPGGGMIEIAIDRHNANARVSVSDEGLGIPAEALPNLFKRFYRVPRSSTAQISGSGIGLYVVKEIVTSHGGTIDVTSTEGIGSTFTVLLPLEGEGADEGDKVTK